MEPVEDLVLPWNKFAVMPRRLTGAYGITATAGTCFCQLVQSIFEVYLRNYFRILLCRRDGDSLDYYERVFL